MIFSVISLVWTMIMVSNNSNFPQLYMIPSTNDNHNCDFFINYQLSKGDLKNDNDKGNRKIYVFYDSPKKTMSYDLLHKQES